MDMSINHQEIDLLQGLLREHIRHLQDNNTSCDMEDDLLEKLHTLREMDSPALRVGR